MSLPDLIGHAELRARFSAALVSGTLPQSILLHGAPGIGKERLGLWIGQLLLCERPGQEPCGECRACRLTRRLEHPDLHWFFPLPRPDAPSPEKLRERLEELRAEELQQWRQDPFRAPAYDRPPAHFLAAIRTIHQLASVRPTVGERNVFVIGDAELMVPQESSPEAANAFLKLLEEPPPATTLILTSSFPGALLPTIRSRSFSVRVSPLKEDDLVRLLVVNGLADEGSAPDIARRAAGSARKAAHLARLGDQPDPDRAAGRELLIAALATEPALRLAAAHERRPAGARNTLVGELDSLAEWLRDLAAVASGRPDRVSDPASLPLLRRAVEQRGVTPTGVIAGMEHVRKARDLALGNVNPQLIVADLLANLQRDLVSSFGHRQPARAS